MHPILALRVFFAVLFNGKTAKRVKACLDSKTSENDLKGLPSPTEKAVEAAPVKPAPNKSGQTPKPRSIDRNGALTLLSALQRDSRLLDLVNESLDSYSDAQIGAAARDVLRDSRKVLDRMFGLKHLVDTPEGETVALPENASPVRWRVLGKASSESGTLSHPGWQATKLDLPQWAGSSEDSMVIAAAEVEA